jgi:formylglycine-generating enzyme required for sulfatase activity
VTETPAAQTPEPTAADEEATEMPAAQTPAGSTTPSAEIDSRGATMALVPGGTFLVGWERLELLGECETFREGCTPPLFDAAGPVHQVQLDAFYIDVNEVTNESFATFLTEIGSHTGVCFGQDCIGLDRSAIQQQGENAFAVADAAMDTHPVTGVTWFGAAAFCQWRGARLPTSAEWEMAAAWDPATGEKTRYPWGNEFDPAATNFCDVNCDAHGFADDESDDGFARTAPVGSFPSGESAIGAMDMSGNVWEWVLDWFDEAFYDLLIEEGVFPVVNPGGPETSDRRVVRGGSWFDTGNFTSSVFRAGVDPTLSDDTLGFRCAADG